MHVNSNYFENFNALTHGLCAPIQWITISLAFYLNVFLCAVFCCVWMEFQMAIFTMQCECFTANLPLPPPLSLNARARVCDCLRVFAYAIIVSMWRLNSFSLQFSEWRGFPAHFPLFIARKSQIIRMYLLHNIKCDGYSFYITEISWTSNGASVRFHSTLLRFLIQFWMHFGFFRWTASSLVEFKCEERSYKGQMWTEG